MSPRRPFSISSAGAKPKRPDHDYADKSRGERLQRVLADAGIASRRACEEMIVQGLVTVNGTVVDSLPAWVDPERDRIVAAGRLLKRGGRPARLLYILLNKPRGTVCTNSDPEGRPRVIDLVRHPDEPRLYTVGRLDLDSSGLILLTNDGELANRLTHPKYEVHKGYEVLVGGRIEDEDLKKLEAGVFLPERGKTGKRTSDSTLEVIKRDRDRTLLFMQLKEGRNRQVRRMLLRVGHPVKRLRRVRMGPLQLKGLAVGEWRELTRPELNALRKAAAIGARAAKAASGTTAGASASSGTRAASQGKSARTPRRT